MKTLKWLGNLFSNSTEVSHKRFISVMAFFVLVLMVFIVSLGKPVNETLIYVFGALVLGQSALTIFNKDVPKV